MSENDEGDEEEQWQRDRTYQINYYNYVCEQVIEYPKKWIENSENIHNLPLRKAKTYKINNNKFVVNSLSSYPPICK